MAFYLPESQSGTDRRISLGQEAESIDWDKSELAARALRVSPRKHNHNIVVRAKEMISLVCQSEII